MANLLDLVPQTGRRADAGRDRAGIDRTHSVLDEAGRDDALVEVVDGRAVDPTRCGGVRLDARAEPVSGSDHRRGARRIRDHGRTEVVARDLGVLVRQAAGATLAPPGDATARMCEHAGEKPVEQVRAARPARAREYAWPALERRMARHDRCGLL